MTTKTNPGDEEITTPTWQIAGLWALVGVPSAWGFIETLLKSVALFTG
tara:strand:- start:428 stop:571 length:144 start_codon:yes stop_codon:yes gene_type:complete